MKRVLFDIDIDLAHILLRDPVSGGVLSAVKAAPYFQSFSRGSAGDELDEGFIVAQRFTMPVR